MSEFVNIWCKVMRSSEAAVQILADDGKTHWIPRSKLQYPEQADDEGKVIALSCLQWIAKEKGLV